MKKQKFIKNLESYGLGYVVTRMDTLQEKIIAAVRETGLKGKLKLDLNFRRVGSNSIKVAAKITPTIPEIPIQTVEMFVDENNHLHEENPDQTNFENVHVLDQDKKNATQI